MEERDKIGEWIRLLVFAEKARERERERERERDGYTTDRPGRLVFHNLNAQGLIGHISRRNHKFGQINLNKKTIKFNYRQKGPKRVLLRVGRGLKNGGFRHSADKSAEEAKN